MGLFECEQKDILKNGSHFGIRFVRGVSFRKTILFKGFKKDKKDFKGFKNLSL